MNFGIILLKSSKILSFDRCRNVQFYSIRCQEFLNHIDTYFLIDKQSPSRLELIERVLSIENQLSEYNQTINQELTIVNETFL